MRWAFVRDEQPPLYVVAQLADRADLLHQRHRVNHNAVADHAGDARVEDATRDEVQDERLGVLAFAPADRVAGVGTALVAGDDVDVLAEQVDDFAFAFVAPLAPDHYGCGHEFAGW